MSNVESIMSKTRIGIDNKLTKKNLTFIRIEDKSVSSYLKAITQYNFYVLPPLIEMCQLSHSFIKSVSIEILKTIHWSENERVPDPAICKN